jgi:hypothetical protein
MNEVKCYVANCSRPAVEGCEICSTTNCSVHLHSKAYPAHPTVPISIILTEEIKESKRSILTSVISKCTSTRLELIKSCETLVKKIQNDTKSLLKTLNQLQEDAQSLLNLLNSYETLQVYKNSSPNESKLLKFLNNTEKPEMLEQLSLIHPEVLSLLLKDFLSSFINSSPTMHNMTFFAFFTRNSGTLNLYNIKENQFKTSKLFDTLGDQAGWCYLPDGNIFHYGGRKKSENIGTTCIINPSNKNVKYLSDGKRKCCVGQVTFYKGEVYVFGGFNKAPLKSAFKYSFLKDSWNDLNDLPMASQDCCSCFYGNSIIVTGESFSGLYEFCRIENSYKIMADFEPGFKAIWSANGRCFCLSQNQVFETGIFEKFVWKRYETCLDFEPKRLMAQTAKRADEIYILFENKKLFAFKLDSRKMVFVTDLPKFS